MKVTKKILLSTYILASGITNTVVYAESISHTPQIYVNIRSASGLNFNKQITEITSEDLSNFPSLDLQELQQNLCLLISKIGYQFCSRTTRDLPSHIDVPLSSPHKIITSMPISESMIAQLKTSIEAIEKTLKFISKPEQILGLVDLPKQNKIILLDLANRLVEEGQTHFSILRETLQKQISEEELLDFDTAADTINFGLQTDQNYEKYTQNGHPKNLFHLVHCFVVSKGYQIQKLDPPIAIEDLQLLIQKIIEHSGHSGHSEQLVELAKQLEFIMKE